MKIALINGSPKSTNSTSENILKMVKRQIDQYEIFEFKIHTPGISTFDMEHMSECDILVFAFPLYVDGVPSHLLHCLYKLEDFFINKTDRNIRVYSLVNCGFFEGNQAHLALDIMKNWCEKAGLMWGQGIGIGGGGMIAQQYRIPDGKGPLKNIDKALKDLVNNFLNLKTEGNIFVSPNFPRFAYKIGGHMGWRKQAKANKVKL